MSTRSSTQGSVAAKTRHGILRAAEKIFAQGGYRAMTLRAVTREAKVNLAAVNYHFGTKVNLVRALILERFQPVNEQRLATLDTLVAQHAPEAVPLEAIFDALFRPLFTGAGCALANDNTLMQIIGRVLTEQADFMRQLHKDVFVELSLRFMQEIKRSCPELSQEQLQYRFFLSVSTMIGTVIEQTRLETISGEQLDSTNLDRILEELTRFVVAGFQQK